MKRALITGITGQDGSYLAELLLAKNYDVHGIVRRTALEDESHRMRNLSAIRDKLTLHTASLDNHLSLYKVIHTVRPDELYHLAASSFVSYSFDDEFSTVVNNFNATHYLVASLKEIVPNCRLYFAGSSEMFGHAAVSPQSETTSFHPRSVYGIAKLSSHHLVDNYRERFGLFACTGILYNHESPRRGYEFVTRKITSAAARIKRGMQDKLHLGNLDALRDWGYAPEYVQAMWLMLQQASPDDYVIATGLLHSVREFAQYAFECVDLDYEDFVVVDKNLFRESEKIPLCGDSSKAHAKLGWKAGKGLRTIINEMVEYDLELIDRSCEKQSFHAL